VEFRVVTGRLAPYRFQWCGLHQHENCTTLPSGLSALCGHLCFFPKSFQIPLPAAVIGFFFKMAGLCVALSRRPNSIFLNHENKPMYLESPKWNCPPRQAFAAFCAANQSSLRCLAAQSAEIWNSAHEKCAHVTVDDLHTEFLGDSLVQQAWQQKSFDDDNDKVSTWVQVQFASLLMEYRSTFADFEAENRDVLTSFAHAAVLKWAKKKKQQLRKDQICDLGQTLISEFLRIRLEKAKQRGRDSWTDKKDLCHPLKLRRWLKMRYYWQYNDILRSEMGPRGATSPNNELSDDSSGSTPKKGQPNNYTAGSRCVDIKLIIEVIDEIRQPLSPLQQTIMRMSCLQGMSLQQIADKLGLLLETIFCNIGKAMQIRSSDERRQAIMGMRLLESMSFDEIAKVLDLAIEEVHKEHDAAVETIEKVLQKK
jgi:hypothetical protein